MPHVQHFASDGVTKIPSVTNVPAIFDKDLDGFYIWACEQIGEHTCCRKAAKAYSEQAKNLGDRIHLIREYILRGMDVGPIQPSEYEQALWKPISDFYAESGYQPVSVETKLTGEKLGGTSDGVGTFSKPFWEGRNKWFYANYPGFDPKVGELWLDDLKIKSKLDKLHPLQFYGYRLLEKECTGRDIKWGLIIRREKDLDKTPQIQLKAYYLPAYEALWNAAWLCWEYLHGK